MTQAQQNAQLDVDDSIDLAKLFQTLIQHWLWFLVCLVLSLSAAYLYLRATKPTYAVDGLIQVSDNKNSSAALLGELSGLVDVKSPAQTEIELIKSRAVLNEVIQNLKLDIVVSSDEDRFSARLNHGLPKSYQYFDQGLTYQIKQKRMHIDAFSVPQHLLDRQLELKVTTDQRYTVQYLGATLLSGKVGAAQTIQTSQGEFKISIHDAAPNSTFFLVKRSERQAIASILSALGVSEKGKQTGIISLSLKGSNQALITQTLNELMRVYVQKNIMQRSTDTQKTLAFLSDQLPQIKKQLEVAELRYNQFREKNNTIDVIKESELLLTQSVELKTKKIELEQKSAELNARYTSSYPLIEDVNAQLKSLEQESQKIERRLQKLPEVQRLYLQLYRDVQVSTELYTSLLNSYQQLKVVKASQSGNVRIVDMAVYPFEQTAPKRSLVLLMASFVGFSLAAILVLIKNALFSGIKSTSTIDTEVRLPILATIPRSALTRKISLSKKTQQLLAVQDGEDLAIESLRSLRTVVHFSSARTSNIILVTGPAPSIGKSFVSSNFAAVLAQQGKSVILVDADMRRGHLHDAFNFGRVAGLAEYLQNKSLALDSVCHDTVVGGLSLLTAGLASPPNPAELLLNERFDHLIKILGASYDFVIIDSPPILAVTDAVIIGRHVGMALMLARYGQTTVKDLKESVSRLSQAGVITSGIVFNDVQKTLGPSYGYQYAYHYRSKK